MNYEDFCTTLVAHISDHIGSDKSDSERIRLYHEGFQGGTAEEKRFVKETNDRYFRSESKCLQGDFIVLKSRDCENNGYVCRFDVHYLYGAYQKGGWKKVDTILDENIHSASAVDADILSCLFDYQKVKDKLILCLRNSMRAKVRYRDAVFQKCDDMIMILYIILHDDGNGNRLIAPVPRESTTTWGLNDNEILAQALDNTARLSPPRLYLSFEDIIAKNRSVGDFMSPFSSMRSIPPGPIAATLTAIPQTDGAVALYYPGVQERIAQLAGGDYYVIFTGKNEARIHPAGSVTVAQMRRGLLDTNRHYPDEMLTVNIYRYDFKGKTLRRI